MVAYVMTADESGLMETELTLCTRGVSCLFEQT